MTQVAIERLRIESAAGAVVDDLSLRIEPGELVALIGESGAGKTTAALALLGHLRPGLRRTAGTVSVGGVDPLAVSERQRRALRSTLVGYVPQAAGGGLNPRMRVERLLAETLRGTPRAQLAAKVDGALGEAGLADVAGILRRYPHELSGGQQQRVAIAMALTGDPSLLVLDEPTAGLDTTTQAHVLDAIDALRRRRPRAVLLISHDLALVARRSDRIAVMTGGRVVEQGPTGRLLTAPSHPFTRALRDASDLATRGPRAADLRAAPGPRAAADLRAAARSAPPLRPDATVLAAEGLCLTHRSHGRTTVAADHVTLRLEAGSCLALVGASGSGKTTIARALAGLHRPDAGQLSLHGRPLPGDVRRRSRDQLRAVQLIPQDPQDTLNPHQRVSDAIERPLRRLHGLDARACRARRDALLDQVGLSTAHAERRPGRLSGGERQRVAIARALAADPAVLICDEITTALDPRTQARIVELLDRLRTQSGVALLLITHDLGLAAALAEQTIVLHEGRVRASTPRRHDAREDDSTRGAVERR